MRQERRTLEVDTCKLQQMPANPTVAPLVHAEITGPGGPAFNVLTAEARDLQKLLQSGSLRSVDLIEAYLAQIQRHNGYLHTVISTVPKDMLLKTAQSLDDERLANKTRSPLHGIPILLKDNIATHPSLGVKTTAGSLALAGSEVPKSMNITNGWSAVGGQTQSACVRGDVNPDDRKHKHSNPTGSSSGPAVAAPAGFAPFTVGTETEGSLIVPAAKAALYAVKPTTSIVPQDGIVPVSHNMDAAGPMTKSAYDLAMLHDHLVTPGKREGESQECHTAAATGSWDGIGIATLDPEVPGSLTVRTLGELIDFDKQNSLSLTRTEAPNQDPMIEARSQNVSSDMYGHHLNHFRNVAKNKALDPVLSEFNVDVVIAPADSLLTCLAWRSGYSVASLPLLYLDYNRRPFGLAHIASAHQERLLIQLMSAWEATFEKRKPLSQIPE
ncbi:amidase family protein [Plenodomus tracheiphilus IPT5]|uniref:Amidase family protein n=1 Tax=Plenodomus tracheiphilus IPT5 TaxID=1408161 RepID=A0A6A7AT39_9PLEO|nr:amidase family protein [Plenodomus tracheiphilus IPT5]